MTEHSRYDLHHEPLPEGEEKAPPGTSTMGLVRWIILGGMTLFAVVMLLGYFGLVPWSGESPESVKYHCPMHPTYITSHPGECPICGMTLVPMASEGDTQNATDTTSSVPADTVRAQPGQYTCPMHPEVISNTPGRCPKCGMNLEQVPGTLQPATYTCPMHPEVTSTQPGQCPKCGMDLVKVESTGASTAGSEVLGLVPVTIAPERLQLIGVRTGTVARRTLEGGIRLLGFVTPDETRVKSVNVRFSGWVRDLVANETGQAVKQGQRLFSVYSQDLFAAEQEYLLAKQSLQAASDPELRDVRLRMFEASRQRLELLGITADERLQLETEGQPRSESWIESPVSGVVLEKNVVPGGFVSPDQNLYVVADLSTVWVLADVYERDLARVKAGQAVQMRSSAYPGQTFRGRVGFIYPSVAEDTRTLKVRIEFANPDGLLKPGQYVEIDLEGGGPSVLAVPSEAVFDEGERQYAFVVQHGTYFEPRLLGLGRHTDDYVEVISGLSEGEQVVTSANFLIDAESRLKAAMTGLAAAPAGGDGAKP